MSRNSRKRVVILGAGGHGQMAADILLSGRTNREKYQLVCFLDDDPELYGQERLGVKVKGGIDQLLSIEHDAVFLAIGDNQIRSELFQELASRGKQFINLIHPSAVVGSHIEMGTGVIMCPGAVVNTGSRIGDNVILNTGSGVGHNSQVGDHAHVSSGARCGGYARIGEGCFLGLNATVLPQVQVGQWSIIGAGAVVLQDIPAFSLVAGVPARKIRDLRRKDSS